MIKVPLKSAVVVVVVLLQGCFLLVSSGIRREIPTGAQAAAQGILKSDEVVVAAWDGSVLQDGGLLAVLTDRRLLKKDGETLSVLELGEVKSIIVNEDDGTVDVVGAASLLSLPLRSSDERRAFARLIQTEVQKRKKAAHEERAPPRVMPTLPVVAPVVVDPVEPPVDPPIKPLETEPPVIG